MFEVIDEGELETALYGLKLRPRHFVALAETMAARGCEGEPIPNVDISVEVTGNRELEELRAVHAAKEQRKAGKVPSPHLHERLGLLELPDARAQQLVLGRERAKHLERRPAAVRWSVRRTVYVLDADWRRARPVVRRVLQGLGASTLLALPLRPLGCSLELMHNMWRA